MFNICFVGFNELVRNSLLVNTNSRYYPLSLHILCFNAHCAGVVETGLFVNMATTAYLGSPDGSVTKKEL